MTERQHVPGTASAANNVNPGYAAGQIAKALTTADLHPDAETRERAHARRVKWESVLRSIVSGSVAYGSRTPVTGVPAWATLEVVKGGFATGGLLAGGPLQGHEEAMLRDIPRAPPGGQRLALNSHFLSEAGFAILADRLRTGRYDLAVPEEGALLVAAWLAEEGHVEEAWELLDEISPYFAKLRFYPIPREEPRRFGSRVHVQSAGETLQIIREIRPNQRVLVQKQAVEVWAPYHDRVVALFLEMMREDLPCQVFPRDWTQRAKSLLGDYARLREQHGLCGKAAKPSGHQAQLRRFLHAYAGGRTAITPSDARQVRVILDRYRTKRGAPGSSACTAARQRQAAGVAAPTHHSISSVVVQRLSFHARDAGIDSEGDLLAPVSRDEATTRHVPEGTAIPASVRRKVARCVNETVQTLVERGLITSGEALARVLPQVSSELRAAGITDPALRQLYAAIYRAFRRRRSLLLVNLQHQVEIEELPWVAGIDRFRSRNLSGRELARQALEEVTALTLTAFPHAILPNKLLQELRALAKAAELDIPLVDELAADIFMGKFTGKFHEAALRAAKLLDGSLYATYYDIPYRDLQIPAEPKRVWPWQPKQAPTVDFSRLCASRADPSRARWGPAANGMIIEQQQILTTQNLAALFIALDLTETLRGQLGDMARRTFQWICRRQQMKVGKWHARLIMIKNTAYAWRQMVFYLALLTPREVREFLGWATEHLGAQPQPFRDRFRPALQGLLLAADGYSPRDPIAANFGARIFLGWSTDTHWLLANDQQPPGRSRP